jgi:NAD(P)-dependent dehydrogenase (short-subunit alcohol dehydrogenase family)
MTNTKSLENKVAIVAGATRGAGRGIACMLGEAGATVYCTGRSIAGRPSTPGRPETVTDTARMVDEHGGTGIAVQVDHTVDEEVRRLFDRVKSDTGRLDILVNNVNGDDLVEWKPFWEQSLEKGLQSMRRSVNSHLITIHSALPLMLDRKGGLIVGITDRGSMSLFHGLGKQSVMRITELLAPELLPHGITAISLTPGFLRSEAMLENFGVTEANWRDAIKKDPFFAASETPFYVGRAVAALAADRRVILKTGTLQSSWELAQEYGFTDIDGSQPNVERVFAPLLEERWQKIIHRVRAQFKEHGFDPGATIQEDRQNLSLSALVSDNPRPQWMKEVLGPPGVAFGDPDTVAKQFYQRFVELRQD